LMVLWFVFLLFVASISFYQPRGYLPVTYGHLQTMADIADEVGDVLFFGDKDEAKPELRRRIQEERYYETEDFDLAVRHAGTSRRRLPPVQVDVPYM
jgi:hypothetical protein